MYYILLLAELQAIIIIQRCSKCHSFKMFKVIATCMYGEVGTYNNIIAYVSTVTTLLSTSGFKKSRL